MDVEYNGIASAFVNSAQDGFMFSNGEALAKLFVFNDQTVEMISSKLQDVRNFGHYTVVVTNAIFAQFTEAYLEYARDSPVLADDERHKLMCRVAELYIAVQAGSQGDWLAPVMRPVALALCRSARRAYRSTGDSGVFTQSASLLLRLLIDLLSDSSPIESSKKLGALFVAGLLLCTSLRTSAAPGAYASKALEVKRLWSQPVFSRRDRTSYSYWLGRYYLVCYYVDSARVQLEYAFNGCPEWHFHNKRAILRHLVVANIIRGRLPSSQLLEKYEMEPVYTHLVYHFRKGNLAGFQRVLADNLDFFRSQGNYLILLERTEILIFRNVLHRTSRILALSGGSSAIPYKDILAAFRLSSQNFDMDILEMESILSSLISQKFVLGFLFHHQQLANLAKRQPFPPISAAGQATNA
ncbi:hypothetical protein GGI04_001518 [Coemansia thaxteri]|nr:hypothetical protein GGI04_001518 [Coemansia thaxteri]KAJ2472608.1 hypothetical protein EV174_005811 [Coemansia sp. RSA 2320]KAJ2472664.1 hypothetical protein GGI02_001427 [Coemansia sp. RSA 2322]